MAEPYLLPPEPLLTYADYQRWGGGAGIARAVELGPTATIGEIAASGLRGRGGGGFPTGTKWTGVAASEEARTFVVANGAEGEPATAKDRTLLRRNPYQVVEGLVIAAYAVGASRAYLATKASYPEEGEAVTRAIADLQDAGVCRDCELAVVSGPDDYLYGEETALLEVVEGRPAFPRIQPPYVEGLFSSPDHPTVTLVNNVETLAHVPVILGRGATWFRGRGTEQSPGHGIATVAGDVREPAVAEFELGTPLRRLVDEVAGGPRAGRRVQAVLPGVAGAVLRDDVLDVPASFEALAAVGSGLGAAGFAVFDDEACMVAVALEASRFLARASCGQCPPCTLGSERITGLLEGLATGRAPDDVLDQLGASLRSVSDGNRCYLGTQERIVVTSILQAFPDEVALHVAGRCSGAPRPGWPEATRVAVGEPAGSDRW